MGQLFQKLKRGAKGRHERLKSKISFPFKRRKCASHTESWWKFCVLTGKNWCSCRFTPCVPIVS